MLCAFAILFSLFCIGNAKNLYLKEKTFIYLCVVKILTCSKKKSMTKEEVLQKVDDYCSEKSYTETTLTKGFKDKFAEHFQKANADVDINDETALASMKFALNTAFSSASAAITEKAKAFEAKNAELSKQLEELKKKSAEPKEEKKLEIPEDVKEQLKELEKFKDAQNKQEKFKNIISMAKQKIRQDLHKSFENYAKDYQVELEMSDEEQAKKLTSRFQEIFKDSIGDIKPLAPKQTQKQEEEFIESLPKIKVC